MRMSQWGVVVLAALAAALVFSAAAPADRPRENAFRTATDTYSVGTAVREGHLPLASTSLPDVPGDGGLRTSGLQAAAADPPIGTVKTFLILDDFFGIYRLANFTLRGVGTHAVAWVRTP